MRYTSTRDKNVDVSSSWAIAQGISADGGLFVPVEIPKVSLDDIAAMANMSYVERAKRVLSLYLTDFTAEELAYCVEGAYGDNKFSSQDIAPIHELKAGEEILELWRGPTCAFKDMALQMLPRLMTVSVKKAVGTRETVILVATSGDTGKAALEGFKDVEGTKILVFYPDEGVSPMQKLQMTTQEGSNVAVCAIKGNFDDAQTGVKTIFTDKEIGKKLAEHGMAFSSANSINWGRLVPQIVYYFSAYCDMIETAESRRAIRLTSSSRPETSAISSPPTMRARWVCRLTALSARRTKTACSPISSTPAFMTSTAASIRPRRRRWIFSFRAILNACSSLRAAIPMSSCVR